LALQVVGQSIPAGLLVTFPSPLMTTDNGDVGGGGGGCTVVNTAVTDSFPFALNVQVGDEGLFPFFFASLALIPWVVQAPV
jgi:hypothetical protein